MNKVFALVVSFVVALGCFMGIFALNSCEVAHADATPVFVPAKEYIVARIYGAQGSPNYYPGGSATNNNMSLMFSWSYDSNRDYVDFYFFNNQAGYMGSAGSLACCNSGLNNAPTVYNFTRGSWQILYFAYQYNASFVSYENILMYYNCYSDFDFGNVKSIFYTSGSDSSGPYNEIRYVDGNNSLFRIQFKVYTDWSSDNRYDFLYSDKTVYVQSTDQTTIDYQAGYEYGYNTGYRLGESEGRQGAYTEGYSNGYTDGEIIGYQNGQHDANTYTFFGLFSAILDAPLKVFKGMLDFEVFGVNLSGFGLSLFSVAMVIAIIRFIMAK